jgi:hypothetical protein
MADKQWAGVFSRTKQKIANNLGIIDGSNRKAVKKFRSDKLERLDSYYECRQYKNLLDWDQAIADDGDYIAVRKRKPRINYALAKVLVDRVSAKLVGQAVYPTFNVEDDPDTPEFLRVVQKAAEMKSRMMAVVKRTLLSGSALARFEIVNGDLRLSCYNSKFCYPTFDASGDLESVRIQYVYDDPVEKNENGEPKKKWFKMELSKSTDILYDNPEFSEEAEPIFTPIDHNAHDLGVVQAEWFRTEESEHSPDGPSLIEDVMGFIDELNYSLSQSSQAVSYNQEPLLTISGIDVEEQEKVVKSSTKALNLGRDGKAEYLETNLGGVEAANTLRDRIKGKVADVARVVMLDPEKIVGSAQSGKAMEVLHGPLVELIDELRPSIEKCMKRLLLKMALALLQLRDRGFDTEVVIPEGYVPQSMDVSVVWPPIFPLTIEDLQKKVMLATSASNASIISRETAMRWLAKDFGVEDIEEELSKIAKQPVLNPFGTF